MADTAIVGLTRGGTEWLPSFVTDLNQEDCIGCGRCYKVCPRTVFELVEREAADKTKTMMMTFQTILPW